MKLLVIKFWVFLLDTCIFQFETNSPINVFLAWSPPQLSEGLYGISLLLPRPVATLLRDNRHYKLKTHCKNQDHQVKVGYVVLKRIGAKSKAIFRLMKYMTVFSKWRKKHKEKNLSHFLIQLASILKVGEKLSGVEHRRGPRVKYTVKF